DAAPRSRLRHSLPPHGDRARGASPRAVRTRRHVRRALGIAVVLILAALPFFAPVYYVNIGSQILVAAVFALSLNLLVGYAGLTSLGHAAYLGVTAYIVAWLTTRAATGHLVAAGVAVTVALVMAGVFGGLAVRGAR